MTTPMVWALYFAMMPAGQVPVVDLMESNIVKDLSGCVQLASIKWNDYYQWNPLHMNNFTYCMEFRDKPRYRRLIDIKCDRDGICTMKGVKE
jgi:hypothetical protein